MAAEGKNPDLISQEKRHESFEGELRSIQEQIHLSSKRNSVESFSSLSSKADLCGKYKYSLKLIYAWGPFNNYVNRISTIFDHLFTPCKQTQ